MLNIIHCHLNDKDEEVTIDTVHMKVIQKKEGEAVGIKVNPNEDEEYEPYMKFENDMHGRPLRYKIVVRDLQVKKILYNTGNSV